MIMRAVLGAGLVVAAVLAFVLWYVYGAWPVPSGYEFPRHSLWGGGPTALFEGTLVERDGCIRTDGGDTVVWPPGYSLSVEAGQPVVHGSGLQVRMGERVRLGGGEYSRSQLGAVASHGAQTRCQAPFFLTTGFVH